MKTIRNGKKQIMKKSKKRNTENQKINKRKNRPQKVPTTTKKTTHNYSLGGSQNRFMGRPYQACVVGKGSKCLSKGEIQSLWQCQVPAGRWAASPTAIYFFFDPKARISLTIEVSFNKNLLPPCDSFMLFLWTPSLELIQYIYFRFLRYSKLT